MPRLADIVGQPAAVERLRRSMAAGRLPHAMVFAGPDGVGRRTTAMALAQTLLCDAAGASPQQAGPSLFGAGPAEPAPAGGLDACGQCVSCQLVAAGTHPDLHVVYKELAAYHDDSSVRDRVMQELGIEIIRSFLIDPAYRSSTRGRGKVFIVLEAELMSTPAQNALLKTLEEPPAGVTIVLVCERPQQLLPTTLSRCGLVHLGPLPREFVAGRLREAGVEQTQADFWGAFTDGSLGRSLQLAAGGMYAMKRDVLDRLAAADADMGEYFGKLAEEMAVQAVAAAKSATGAELSKTLATRQASSLMLEIIASAFRDAMHAAAGVGSLVHADQAGAIEALRRRFDPTQLADIIEQLSQFEEMLWRNVNAKVVWDNVAITCTSAARLEL